MLHKEIHPPVSVDDDTGSCLHSPGGQIIISLHSCRWEKRQIKPWNLKKKTKKHPSEVCKWNKELAYNQIRGIEGNCSGGGGFQPWHLSWTFGNAASQKWPVLLWKYGTERPERRTFGKTKNIYAAPSCRVRRLDSIIYGPLHLAVGQML